MGVSLHTLRFFFPVIKKFCLKTYSIMGLPLNSKKYMPLGLPHCLKAFLSELLRVRQSRFP